MRLALAAFGAALVLGATANKEPAMMKKCTAVLTVPAVEPVLEFWVERLGFEISMKVPDEGPLDFVGLKQGNVEIMVQTRAALEADLKGLSVAKTDWTSILFVEVADLDAVAAKIREDEIAMPRRVTFYGMDELVVRDPAGHLIVFAQPAAE